MAAARMLFTLTDIPLGGMSRDMRTFAERSGIIRRISHISVMLLCARELICVHGPDSTGANGAS